MLHFDVRDADAGSVLDATLGSDFAMAAMRLDLVSIDLGVASHVYYVWISSHVYRAWISSHVYCISSHVYYIWMSSHVYYVCTKGDVTCALWMAPHDLL